ncbi:MAG: hypothetical protein KJ666_04815 [Bacteroidetes bacterium]|nr:hypothetical protein [Bacteroidota bacterium]
MNTIAENKIETFAVEQLQSLYWEYPHGLAIDKFDERMGKNKGFYLKIKVFFQKSSRFYWYLNSDIEMDIYNFK